jgi:hypothetical protein
VYVFENLKLVGLIVLLQIFFHPGQHRIRGIPRFCLSSFQLNSGTTPWSPNVLMINLNDFISS